MRKKTALLWNWHPSRRVLATDWCCSVLDPIHKEPAQIAQ